jgi:hypothetical protein
VIRLAVAVAFLAGCGSAPPPVVVVAEPVAIPLPPASGTPIGLLLEEGERLRLRPEQRAALEDIDQRLLARNEQLAGRMRAADRPADPPPGRPGGGRRGGMGMGGGRGRGGGPPPQHRKPHGPPGGAPDASAQLEGNMRAAVDEAMAALDAEQRAAAGDLLREHGMSAPPPAE